MQIQKSVFISYRRTNVPIALLVYKHLTSHGYDVFFDVATLDSGAFSQIIPLQIAARAHFILILTPSALERCVSPDDWVRLEIEEAIKLKRNIIPLFFEKFEFNELVQPYLKGDFLPLLPEYNGVNIPWDYLDEGLNRLETRFLNKPLESVIHPLPKHVQEAAYAEETLIDEQAAPSKEAIKTLEHFERGFRLFKQSQYTEAIEEFNQAIALGANTSFSTLALYRRGIVYQFQGNSEKALADFNKVIELNPDNDDAYLHRGVLYAEQNDYEKALADYNKSIELNPESDDAYLNRGVLYSEQNDYEKALADYSKSIELNPDSAGAYNLRGFLYKKQSDYEKALADFDKVIELDPEDISVYYLRGALYFEQNDYEKALADFDKVIELDPDDASAYARRGVLYFEQNDYKKALADFNKAIELNPDDVRICYHRGACYEGLKDYETALTAYKRANSLLPNHPDILDSISRVEKLLNSQ